ncbi:MAG: hypothetical protein ACRDY7_13940 [Acidimicrobiia bacterium]
MLSDSCLTALRMAAVLAHRLPVGLRLVHGGIRIVEVSRCPDQAGCRARQLPPCAFRAAVAEARRMSREGRQLAFCGLSAAAEVDIEVVLPAGGAARPGGIYQVPWGAEVLLAFATPADPDQCLSAASRLGLAVHIDAELGVCLVHTAVGSGEVAMAEELCVTALARVTAAEVISQAAASV